jgi:glycosyltransferase involved in cell wall biosynthesis
MLRNGLTLNRSSANTSEAGALRFSLIIPAYNEERYLPKLLDSVHQARAVYQGGADRIEVIVVDNASTDATASIALSRACKVVREEKRIIAAVRNAGACVAQGILLAFVDADSRIHAETFNAVEKALANAKIIGGATGVELERMSLGIAINFIYMIPLIWLTGMDSGVVFCRRTDFEAVKGYNEQRLFAEDVDFLLKLKHLGKKRKQRLIRLTRVKAVTSSRKFDQFGDWHYPGLMLRGLFHMLFPKYSMKKFTQKYWYDALR